MTKTKTTTENNNGTATHGGDGGNNANNDDDEEEGSWYIPFPQKSRQRRGNSASPTTPLVRTRNNKNNNNQSRTSSRSYQRSFRDTYFSPLKNKSSPSVLFGDSPLNSSKQQQQQQQNFYNRRDDIVVDNLKPSGLSGFFFGFMYEEPLVEDSILAYEDDQSTASIWNPLNLSLFVAFSLTTAAISVPVILVPTIGEELFDNSNIEEATTFTSRAAASAVMGTACGKFLNGPVGDVLGARRTCVLYSFFLALSLLSLSVCNDTTCAAWACFFVEFFYSVQWPCIIVILATHYRFGSHHLYEGGIYVTSIASRFGTLVGMPLATILLRHSHWRIVSMVGAWIAVISASVSYLFLSDSPGSLNEPQNPLHPSLLHQIACADIVTNPQHLLSIGWNVIKSILFTNLLPSLEHVVKSGTFWIVALAHTGSSMVRTSERILGTYFRDTSMGTLSENRASSLAVFPSFGTILGLVIAGNMFTGRKERQRKWLVSKLYKITIAACYTLAFLALPTVRYFVNSPGLILTFQVMASFAMSFGISVMFYHIPGLVGAAFGSNKGLYSAYTDGVGYGVASLVWRIVGSAVSHGNPQGAGWSYGWAAVALLVVLSAILMVEFMEHYFVRASGRHNGTYETIIFA